MQNTIQEILQIEWKMFQDVQSASGRADCQDEYGTFLIMRQSQIEAWGSAVCESYLEDLKQAIQRNGNLLSEKYAYMMEYTAPQEFEEIKGNLPPISDEKRKLARAITDVQVRWQEELAQAYPKIVENGRPVHTHEERGGFTSYETYLIGELSTYSMKTLEAYDAYIKQLVTEKKSLNEMVLEGMVHKYGYASLQAAEDKLAQHNM